MCIRDSSKNGTESEEKTGKTGTNPTTTPEGTGSGSGTGSDSGSDSGNDSTPNNGGPASGSTTGGSSSTDSGAQNSTNGSSGADNANIAGNASTAASGFNASTKPGNKVSAKHFSQLVKTGDEVGQAGLISAIIGALGAATAFFSRKKKRE